MSRRIFVIFSLLLAFLCFYSCSGPASSNEMGDSSLPDGENESEIQLPSMNGGGFSDIVYSMPDTDLVINTLKTTSEELALGNKTDAEAVSAVKRCRELWENYSTMLSYAEIRFCENKLDDEAREDYSLLSERSLEVDYYRQVLLLTVRDSKFKQAVDRGVFYDGYLEEFAKDAALTEELTALLKEEARLKVRLLSLSTATVHISYEGYTERLEDIEKKLETEFGKGTQQFESAMSNCRAKYQKRFEESYWSVALELIRVRSLIADEYGYESYSDYAYAELLGYTATEAESYLNGIYEYSSAIYSELSQIFTRYFYSNSAPEKSFDKVSKEVYDLYCAKSDDLFRVYSHMLSAELYSAEKKNSGRIKVPLSPYLSEISSPYLFINTDGTLRDISVIATEFGRYFGSYLSGGSISSEAHEELSAQCLRLLTLASFSRVLSTDEYKFLLYSELDSVFSELINKSYYARLEEAIYSLDYSEVNKENIQRLTEEIAEQMGIFAPSNAEEILPEAMSVSPYSSMSKCLALGAALELFFTEINSENAGYKVYLSLAAEPTDTDYKTHLLAVGLSSPFEAEYLKKLSDEVYFHINGYHYYSSESSEPGST